MLVYSFSKKAYIILISVLFAIIIAAGATLAEYSSERLVSVGKVYTWVGKTPHKDYLDTNNSKFSDGAVGLNDYTDKHWVGVWSATAFSAQMDLGETKQIESARVHVLSGAAGVKWPKSMVVSVSQDGSQWQKLGEVAGPEYVAGSLTSQWLGMDGISTSARYIRVEFKPNTGGHFVFVSELEVYAAR